ncbi:hypothetical protein ABPG73_006772 [Tetrahymena malaccensis]
MILFNSLANFQNSSLTSHTSVDIDLCSRDIRDEQISQLTQPLSQCLNLQILNLFISHNCLREQGGSSLGSALSNLVNLQKLTLQFNRNSIGDLTDQMIATNLSGLTKLTTFTLKLMQSQFKFLK